MRSLVKPFAAWLALLLLASAIGACSSPGGSGGGNASGEEGAGNGSTVNVNAEGFPIVDASLGLTVFGCRDASQAPWKDILVFREYEKMTNLQMDFQETPQQGCPEKRNLLFASNDLPDIFLRAQMTNEDIARYGMKEKAIVPLNDLIDRYAPNMKALLDKYPEVRQAVTAPDGNIYALPMVRELGTERTDKIWINKTWLDKLNLKAPTNVEELKQVLVAFRDQDPNGNGQQDEIPLGFRDMGHVYKALTGSFGLDYQLGYNINIENGKVKIWLADDRYKEVLSLLRDLYAEGLLWPEFYKVDIPKWRANLAQAKFGMFFIQASDPFSTVEDQFTGMAPIAGPHGDQIYSHAGPMAAGAGFAISKTNSHPEASIRWIDYFFSEEGTQFFRFGIEGQTYTMQDGKPVFIDSILQDERGFMAAVGEINLSAGGGFPHLITDKTGGPINNEKVREVQSFIEPYIPEKIYAAPIFDVETSEQVLAIKADVDKYVSETSAKIILGEIGLDQWDQYVDTLAKMGLPELEEVYQNAYDRMKE